MSKIRIFIFLFFILITQEVVSQQLSLDSAILIALRNNPGLMISKNNMDIARISNSFGMAGGLPQVLVRDPGDDEPGAAIFKSPE
jgi:outer membrane protein